MSVQSQYLQKRMPAADAVRLVRDGDFIIVPTGVGEPPTLLTALSEQRRRFRDVKVAQILAMRKYGYIDPDTMEHVRHVAFFFGGALAWAARKAGSTSSPTISPKCRADRARPDSGRRRVLDGLADGRPRLLRAQPGRRLHDGGGRQGARGGARGQPERALRLRQLPCAHLAGDGAGGEQRAGARSRPAEDRPGAAGHRQVCGRHDRGRLDAADRLRRHSRCGGDAADAQARPGHPHRNDRRRHPDTGRKRRGHQPQKDLLPGKMVATFALGSNKLYRFMERNPALEIHPVDFTNDPYIAGQNDKLVAINATLQIDLLGQCGSRKPGATCPIPAPAARSTSCARPTARAAARPSSCCRRRPRMTASRASCRRLRPAPMSPPSKNDINYVVTEYGVAQLRGKSAKQRAQELIAIAHPRFAPSLSEQARR